MFNVKTKLAQHGPWYLFEKLLEIGQNVKINEFEFVVFESV